MITIQKIRQRGTWPSIIMLSVLTGCAMPGNNTLADEKASENRTIQYYVGKLSDRDYVARYGDADNPRPWYIAAEALGAMGKPAIPGLIKRLDTRDPYELKLVLYALMLASQDPDLRADTQGDYLMLSTVLTEDSNKENLRLAREWWERYQHLW